MAKLFVDNWKKHQHYKDRNPPWIKLATGTFQNYDFGRLHDASKLLAICIWTLASRSDDGSVPHDFAYIKSQCCLGEMIEEKHLTDLIQKGFLKASNPLASRKQSAMPETEGETEERRGETPAPNSKNGRESLPEVNTAPKGHIATEVVPQNSDLMVSMLVEAHPRNLSPQRSEFEAMEAIKRESKRFGGEQQAYEYLLERTKLYAKLTANWSQEDKDFIPAADTWFREKRYQVDQKLWVKGEAIPQPPNLLDKLKREQGERPDAKRA